MGRADWPEGDRHRQGWRAAQGDRPRRATRAQGAFRPAGASRALGQGQGRLVGQRVRAEELRVRIVSAAARRISLEPAFLLHHHPWRDSSRILELLTRSQGRVAVFARAARRGGSALPAALQPFGTILVSYSARGDAGQLTAAERSGTVATLSGERLMSGFYANELLIKLLPRNDPHPRLYDAYETLVAALVDAGADAARALRVFEKRLLDELGYGLNLETDASSGLPVAASASYR